MQLDFNLGANVEMNSQSVVVFLEIFYSALGHGCTLGQNVSRGQSSYRQLEVPNCIKQFGIPLVSPHSIDFKLFKDYKSILG